MDVAQALCVRISTLWINTRIAKDSPESYKEDRGDCHFLSRGDVKLPYFMLRKKYEDKIREYIECSTGDFNSARIQAVTAVQWVPELMYRRTQENCKKNANSIPH